MTPTLLRLRHELVDEGLLVGHAERDPEEVRRQCIDLAPPWPAAHRRADSRANAPTIFRSGYARRTLAIAALFSASLAPNMIEGQPELLGLARDDRGTGRWSPTRSGSGFDDRSLDTMTSGWPSALIRSAARNSRSVIGSVEQRDSTSPLAEVRYSGRLDPPARMHHLDHEVRGLLADRARRAAARPRLPGGRRRSPPCRQG